MRRVWRGLQRFWEHDPGLSVILGLLVLLAFVLPPFSGPPDERGPVADLAFSLLLLVGVAGLKTGPLVRWLLLTAALGATSARFWPSSSEVALALGSLVSLSLMAIVVLAQAFRAGPVNAHRIQGAVAAYLLLGMAWGSAYQLVAALSPGAFASASTAAIGSRSWIYFSFVTLTTVGYGDMTPVHPVARSLAVMEALTGQLYPAILLARLVSLQTSRPEAS